MAMDVKHSMAPHQHQIILSEGVSQKAGLISPFQEILKQFSFFAHRGVPPQKGNYIYLFELEPHAKS
jgi:hypothetical protein